MLQGVNPLVIALAVPGALVVVWILQTGYIEYRIRRSPGVRAKVIAKNPIGCKPTTCLLSW